MVDEEPSPEELAGAEALRRALEGAPAQDKEAQAAALIAASAGRARLGELAARRIVRGALAKADHPARWKRWALAAVAAAVALFIVAVARPSPAPRALFTAPFPSGQTAAQRLDLVITGRMIAFRESRLYGARR